jgi:hypothetical protein
MRYYETCHISLFHIIDIPQKQCANNGHKSLLVVLHRNRQESKVFSSVIHLFDATVQVLCHVITFVNKPQKVEPCFAVEGTNFYWHFKKFVAT